MLLVAQLFLRNKAIIPAAFIVIFNDFPIFAVVWYFSSKENIRFFCMYPSLDSVKNMQAGFLRHPVTSYVPMHNTGLSGACHNGMPGFRRNRL